MNVSNKYPGVAQLVAHLTGGQGVVSSSLATRTSKSPETATVSGLSDFSFLNLDPKSQWDPDWISFLIGAHFHFWKWDIG